MRARLPCSSIGLAPHDAPAGRWCFLRTTTCSVTREWPAISSPRSGCGTCCRIARATSMRPRSQRWDVTGATSSAHAPDASASVAKAAALPSIIRGPATWKRCPWKSSCTAAAPLCVSSACALNRARPSKSDSRRKSKTVLCLHHEPMVTRDEKPGVLLLGAHENEALPVLENLHRHGVPVTAAAPRRLSMGLFSRYPLRRLRCPHPDNEPDRFGEWVE